jgi:LysM repeat protein
MTGQPRVHVHSSFVPSHRPVPAAWWEETMKRLLVLAAALSLSLSVFAQPAEKKNTPEEYVALYKDDAVREMQLYKVPASITLAQGMLESDNGNSALAVYANNHFGIKCHKEWTGETYTQDDDEKDECFRKYGSVYDSYTDHSEFLKTRPRYAFLFDLKINDYKGWATGLKTAGYATDPKYAERLINLIERYKLNEYDKLEGVTPVAAEPQKSEGTKTVAINVMQKREVFLNNNRKYIVVKSGDSFMKIAQELEMGVWQLYKYNDMNKNTVLKPGQMLYIQPKRRKAQDDKCQVRPGQTMHDISQLYGVKLKKLYQYNSMEPGTQPKAGQVIYLRAPKPENP